MARLPRLCPSGIASHLIQRGNNRQPCFTTDADFAAYTTWLTEASVLCGVAVHAWVFMTNHVHLLVTPARDDAVSRMMQMIGRRYVRYFNDRYRRTGTLWEGRFRSCVVQSDGYLLNCLRYIESNPVRAGMVEHPGDYHWSSYHTHALGRASTLHTPHEAYLRLGRDPAARLAVYRALFDERPPNPFIEEIRTATNKGLALGSEQFKSEIERLWQRRVRTLKPGRARISAARPG